MIGKDSQVDAVLDTHGILEGPPKFWPRMHAIIYGITV